jgi:polysaccharide chain length determinant protein (PEP-CTERM system associated)
VDNLKLLIELYLHGLWARRWSILSVAWLVCLGGWLMVATLPNRYTSDAQVYVDTESILGPLMQGIAVTQNIDRQVDMMRRTLLSRPNVEQLVQMTNLDIELGVEDARGREGLIASLMGQVRVSALGRNLYQVSYTSTEPERAYRVVDSVLQIFVEQNLGVSQRDVDTARGFIDGQIADYERQLREAELRVAAFRQTHAEELGGVERFQRQLEGAEANARRLASELESLIWRRDQLRLRLASTPPFLSAAAAASGPTIAEQRLSALQERLDQLLLTYTDQHPDIRSLQNLIAQAEMVVEGQRLGQDGGSAGPRVRNILHDQIGGELENTELMIVDLRRRIGLVDEEIGRLAARVGIVPEVEADWTRLNRDYDVVLSQYQALTQRRESALMAQRLDAETNRIEFRIVEPPVVPLRPSGPPHGILMGAVLVVGLGAGVALAFLRVQFDSSLRTAAQLKEAFGLPVLGAISVVRSSIARRLRTLEIASFGSAVAALLVVFAGLFYLFQMAPEKPDLPVLAESLKTELMARLEPYL